MDSLPPISVQSYNGWRFCPNCQNLLKPFQSTDDPEVLLFKCRNEKCGQNGIIPVLINPSVSKESLLIKKDYQAAKAVDITDSSLVLDPSMPRKRVTCRKCGFEEAIYFMITDEKEIIVQYICGRKQDYICGERWRQKDLNQPFVSIV